MDDVTDAWIDDDIDDTDIFTMQDMQYALGLEKHEVMRLVKEGTLPISDYDEETGGAGFAPSDVQTYLQREQGWEGTIPNQWNADPESIDRANAPKEVPMLQRERTQSYEEYKAEQNEETVSLFPAQPEQNRYSGGNSHAFETGSGWEDG